MLDTYASFDNLLLLRVGAIMTKQFKVISTCVSFIALAGCVSPEQANQVYSSQTPPTAAVKKAVVDYAKKTYFDPYSMRDVSISAMVTLGETGLNSVCIRMNAKNRMGAYTGLSVTSIRLKDGAVVSALQDAFGCNDQRLVYYPFPELEGV
jgi:hypothetical protein